MSELADAERRAKRSWARPGGSHDIIVRILKIALPAAVGVILAYFLLAPLEEKQEVSFLLDKTKVERAEERMRVQSAQYRGQDATGRPFVLSARSALQESAAVPVVEVGDMTAQILLDNGPARIDAGRALYHMDRDQVDVMGAVLFTAADGYRLSTSDVLVDLRHRTMASRGRVEGQMPLGRFTAGAMRVELADRRVILTGRARLHIVQGALR